MNYVLSRITGFRSLSSHSQMLRPDDRERMYQLCELIEREQDRDRFLQLIEELNELLERNERPPQESS